jgi:adenylate cyclase
MAKPLGTAQRLMYGALTGVAGAIVALLLHHLGVLSPWEAKTWDWRASLLAKPGKATDQICIIRLDQESLDWAKNESGLTWPWPREMYSAVVDFCRRSGARALAFDVLFTEASSYGVHDDQAFGAALSNFGQGVAALFLGHSTGQATRWPDEQPPPALTIKGIETWRAHIDTKDIAFPRATLPIPEVTQGAAMLANVHLDPDPDGTYRRATLFGIFDGRALPCLGLGAYLAAHPDKAMSIEPGRLTIGPFSVPLDDQGTAIIRFRGPSQTHRSYSAAAVIQSELRIRSGEVPSIQDQNAFRDKYVFFGFTAPGLFDLRSAPVGGVYPGVEVNATILDNLLSDDFLHEATGGQTAAVVTLLALGCGAFIFWARRPTAILLVAALSFALPVLLCLGAYTKGTWLPLVAQEIAAAGSMSLALVISYATEGRQKRFIKNAFQQYLSPAVIEQLMHHPERLKLGGERRVLSIFFSDLQGFTGISEVLSPEDLTALLNEYLSAMTEIIQEEGGTIDKYEGDAIIAFWNAPLELPDHAGRAVRAALRCQARLAALRPHFRKQTGKELFMRVGLNTGPAVVGNMGSRTRFDYTMLGDAVNLASRLEGVNKRFGTYTIVSEATAELLNNEFALRRLARVAVVGRKEPVTIYEPFLRSDYEPRSAALQEFLQGLAFFEQGAFPQAREVFLHLNEHDPAAASYAEECEKLIQSAPQDWQGVWVMDAK